LLTFNFYKQFSKHQVKLYLQQDKLWNGCNRSDKFSEGDTTIHIVSLAEIFYLNFCQYNVFGHNLQTTNARKPIKMRIFA